MSKTLFFLKTCVLFLTTCSSLHAQTITTVAGNGYGAGTGIGGYSGDSGPAVAAKLSDPAAVICDSAGNLYIADQLNMRVRKVDVTGNITTIAGTGLTGDSGDGAPATSATLSFPQGLAFDGAGNLYISCMHYVRKINAGGIISTIAGGGATGLGDGGPATSAELNNPLGIAFDKTGNLYIADHDNNRLRKVDLTGIITSVAGGAAALGDGGPADSSGLFSPSAVVIDTSGNIFIADAGNDRIRKINTSGIISTFAGGACNNSGDGGAATWAGLCSPSAIALDNAGNMYIADGNNRIRKVNAAGIISNYAGTGTLGYTGDNGLATAATLRYATGLAIDKNGNLYIADNSNNVVRRVSAESAAVRPLQEQEIISVSPNPSTGIFNISFPISTQNTMVTVTDLLGRLVYATTIAPSNTRVEVDISTESAGFYFLTFNTGVDIITRKIAKQ